VAEQLILKRVSDHPVPISVVVDDVGCPPDMDAPDGSQVDLLGAGFTQSTDVPYPSFLGCEM